MLVDALPPLFHFGSLPKTRVPAMNLGILTLTMSFTAAAPPMVGPAPAVPPPLAAPFPVAAPFTFVKVFGPPGSKTTWYPGTPQAVATAEDVPVGLRPGYSYRLQLENVGRDGKETIYPSIEVRGVLMSRPNLNVADHPIPIIFSDDDLQRILEGRFLTKVYFLEDPDKADNGPQPLGVPLELSAATEEEAFKEAHSRGRMMVVVRAGERLWTKEELAVENVPGTIYFPGMKIFPRPAAPPRVLYNGMALYDPLLGPAIPGEECMHDGGDEKRPLGIGHGDRLYGLDPSDTAIEFTTPTGKKVATSNRVCICIPRYAAMRFELAVTGNHGFLSPIVNIESRGQRTLVKRVPSLMLENLEQPVGAVGKLRASSLIKETTPLVRDTFTGKLAALATVKGLQVVAKVVEPEDLTVYCNSLILQKRMDPPFPKRIGEVVTFFLRYQNTTLQPMTDVVISDSLTGRLEYIEASAQSDRASTFTAVPNEAGSLILRWSIDGKLLPGQVGMISFKARIR